MKHIVETKKTVEQASRDLQSAVAARGFGVLHAYDLKAVLKEKGINFPHECRIFEICNPQQAAAVLAEDIGMNMALPCRLSVWEENGRTKIGMIPPRAMLEMLSRSPVIGRIAAEAESAMKAMIQSAK